MITQKDLKKYLFYNPESGIFLWRVSKGSRAKEGDIAGSINKSTGYREIAINSKHYLAHRLAFLYMSGDLPENAVDHINRSRTDNSWGNLRRVTLKENHRNRTMHRSNTSGITGVRLIKSSMKWVSEIRVDYKLLYLGVYVDVFDAICARKSAEIKHGFHENHGTKL